MRIDPRLKAPGVEVTGDVLEFDDLELHGVAEALADEVKRAIAAQPGNAWNRTGRLMRSVHAEGSDVVAASDRLSRDPELAQKFAADVLPADPLSDRRVHEAAEKAVHDAISRKP